MPFRPSAERLLSDSFRDLKATGMVSADLDYSENLVLWGTDSPLDSIAFLSLISGLEGRLQQYLGIDIELTWELLEGRTAEPLDIATLLDIVVEIAEGSYA